MERRLDLTPPPVHASRSASGVAASDGSQAFARMEEFEEAGTEQTTEQSQTEPVEASQQLVGSGSVSLSHTGTLTTNARAQCSWTSALTMLITMISMLAGAVTSAKTYEAKLPKPKQCQMEPVEAFHGSGKMGLPHAGDMTQYRKPVLVARRVDSNHDYADNDGRRTDWGADLSIQI